MTINNSMKMAWQAFRVNKVRAALTVLGIVIGIAAVIIVFSAGEGVNNIVLSQIESFGTDIIETEIKVPTTKQGAAAESQSATALVQGVQITTLNLDDMKDIDKLANVEKSYAAVTSQEQVNYGNQLRRALIWGVSASVIDIDKTQVEYGRFFSEPEEKSLAQLAVLGSKMAEKLFGDEDPIGKSIKIRKSKYQVIGVMEERGAVFGMDYDDLIYIPLMTAQKKLMGIDHVLFMIHQLNDLSIASETAEEIRMILRENHDIKIPADPKDVSKDDFRVVTMTEMMDTLNVITEAMTLLLLAIVAISLVVGGVGITNIMYVIVTERTSEIGLRKAVGANYKDIMMQFLAESVLITVIGGIIGIIFGILVSSLISWGATQAGFDWGFSIPIKAFAVALAFSIIFGIGFGLYPARKAARMTPIEALRNE